MDLSFHMLRGESSALGVGNGHDYPNLSPLLQAFCWQERTSQTDGQ